MYREITIPFGEIVRLDLGDGGALGLKFRRNGASAVNVAIDSPARVSRDEIAAVPFAAKPSPIARVRARERSRKPA